MGVTLRNNSLDFEWEVSCEQYNLMGVAPSGWVVLASDCGRYQENFLTPFATLGLETGVGGPPGRRYYYTGTVTDNRVIIPLGSLSLPPIEANVEAVIRRQQYLPSEPGVVRDFAVNLDDNSIDFRPELNLNGQTCVVIAFK